MCVGLGCGFDCHLDAGLIFPFKTKISPETTIFSFGYRFLNVASLLSCCSTQCPIAPSFQFPIPTLCCDSFLVQLTILAHFFCITFEEDMQRNPPGNPQMYVKEANTLGSKVDGYYGVTMAPPAFVEEFTSVGEQSAHSRLKPTKLLN